MHINSSPVCVCNGCMQLRLVKSGAWLDAWAESYINVPEIPYKARVLLIDTVMALRSLDSPAPPPAPQEGRPQRITPPAIVAGPEVPPDVLAAARRIVEAPRPPPLPPKKPEPKPEPDRADRFALIEID